MLSTNGIELNEINAAQLPSDRASSIQSRYLVSALYIYRIYIYIYGTARSYRHNCLSCATLYILFWSRFLCSSVGNPTGGRIFVSLLRSVLLISVINTSLAVLDLINLIRIYERVDFNFASLPWNRAADVSLKSTSGDHGHITPLNGSNL